MFHLQKLLIVVILIVGVLNFGEGRRCHVCTSNRDFCALVRLPKILLENCFDEPNRVRQDDDGCFHHNHNGIVERGCLSRLVPAQYKDCKQSDWCKKCYEDNCNNEHYFPNRSTDAQITFASYESVTKPITDSKAAAMVHHPFGLISSFILVAFGSK